VRLLLVPAVLFAAVWISVFALAEWHPAKKDEAATAAAGTGSAAERGRALYEERCASCHDTGVGPPLEGSSISLADARAQIEDGGGGMPANLVTGQDLEDVIAYLENVLGS
jgi:mono/diheme cytochrome c family protein